MEGSRLVRLGPMPPGCSGGFIDLVFMAKVLGSFFPLLVSYPPSGPEKSDGYVHRGVSALCAGPDSETMSMHAHLFGVCHRLPAEVHPFYGRPENLYPAGKNLPGN